MTRYGRRGAAIAETHPPPIFRATGQRGRDMESKRKAAKAATTAHPETGGVCRRSSESATGRAGDVPAADTPRRELCNRCGHQWKPRTGGTPPKKCPHCDSPNWNKPTINYFCYKCKHIWTARRRGISRRCPHCHEPIHEGFYSPFPRTYFESEIVPRLKAQARCEKQWETKRKKARKG